MLFNRQFPVLEQQLKPQSGRLVPLQSLDSIAAFSFDCFAPASIVGGQNGAENDEREIPSDSLLKCSRFMDRNQHFVAFNMFSTDWNSFKCARGHTPDPRSASDLVAEQQEAEPRLLRFSCGPWHMSRCGIWKRLGLGLRFQEKNLTGSA
eukprot:jgi/Botrbrau1/671/Bobra.0161s0054.1